MATDLEVGKVLAFIAAGMQKPISAESVTVYAEMLADLPVEALQAAAKKVLVNHKYATYPSIAELREAAVDSMRGEVVGISAADAWSLATRIAGRTDPDEGNAFGPGGSFERACKKVGQDRDISSVVAAMQKFGVRSMCFTDGASIETMRSQFMRTFEQLASAEKQRALLPPRLVDAIESGAASGPATLPMPAIEALKRIGTER